MPLFRPSLLCRATAAAAATTTSRQAARDTLRARTASTAYPVIPTCPSPSCPCAEMPQDLDIDRSIDLNGTIAPYAEHLIIPSGQADWKSKIEDERDAAPWGQLTSNVKKALSQKGDFHDPYHNVVVSTTSFESPEYETSELTTRALLFPSFKMVEKVKTKAEDIPDFVHTFLLPQKLHPSYEQLSEEEQQGKRRDITNLTSSYWSGKVHPISSPTILICSHHSRDSRCGILGPLLHAEFSQYINKRHTLRNASSDDMVKASGTTSQSFASHPTFRPDMIDRQNNNQHPINVGMISHIGGHKFAGNVIVYIPPDHQCQPVERETHGAKPKDKIDSTKIVKAPHHEDETSDIVSEDLSPLAGKGIWYGRVEPKHVQGIVEQTIGRGSIIRELFRGGVNQDGSSIRLGLY